MIFDLDVKLYRVRPEVCKRTVLDIFNSDSWFLSRTIPQFVASNSQSSSVPCAISDDESARFTSAQSSLPKMPFSNLCLTLIIQNLGCAGW